MSSAWDDELATIGSTSLADQPTRAITPTTDRRCKPINPELAEQRKRIAANARQHLIKRPSASSSSVHLPSIPAGIREEINRAQNAADFPLGSYIKRLLSSRVDPVGNELPSDESTKTRPIAGLDDE